MSNMSTLLYLFRCLQSLESLDNGKPYTAALFGDVTATIKTFRYYAGWANKLQGKTVNFGR